MNKDTFTREQACAWFICSYYGCSLHLVTSVLYIWILRTHLFSAFEHICHVNTSIIKRFYNIRVHVSCQYMSCPYVCHVNASIISLLYIRTHFSYQYICHTCSSHSDIPNTLLLYIRTHLSYQQIYHIRTVLYFQTHLSYLFSTFKHMFHINTPVISVLNIRTSWHLSYQYICHICPLHSNTSFILKHVSCLCYIQIHQSYSNKSVMSVLYIRIHLWYSEIQFDALDGSTYKRERCCGVIIHICIHTRVFATMHMCNDTAAPYTHMYSHACICYGI